MSIDKTKAGSHNRTAKNILIIGHAGQGKSTLVNKIIKGSKNYIVFDPNGEYGDNGFYDENLELFIDIAQKVKNCFVVFEEATAFFSINGRNRSLLDILTRKRHRNNTNIFLFHSLSDVPLYIKNHIDIICLFHTKDSDKSVETKFKGNTDILEGFKKMKKDKSIGKFVEIKP